MYKCRCSKVCYSFSDRMFASKATSIDVTFHKIKCYFSTIFFIQSVILKSKCHSIAAPPCRHRVCIVALMIPANATHWNNVVLMLGQRRRRWAGIKTTFIQCVQFSGMMREFTVMWRVFVQFGLTGSHSGRRNLSAALQSQKAVSAHL